MVVVKTKDSHLGIKLIDFAFSRQCTKKLIKSEKGTFNYMPPEQLLGELVDLKKCDIFSLGVVLYIIFNILPPFSHNTQMQYSAGLLLTHKLKYSPPTYKSGIPEEL
jgi:serine/threonine protein kinase